MILKKDEYTVVFDGITDVDLGQTFGCGQCFHWDEHNGGWRGFAGPYRCFVYSEEDKMYIKSLTPVKDMQAFGEYMKHYLSLDMDYRGMKKQFSHNDMMKRAIEYAPGIDRKSVV